MTVSYSPQLIEANQTVLLAQSRSFSIPILQLDEALRIPVMVQYNLNKSIDTLEDHTSLSVSEKIHWIQTFCENLSAGKPTPQLSETLLSLTPRDESSVLTHHKAIIALYNELPNNVRALGLRWTVEMANGMCDFLQRPVKTPDVLNLYCYYVAGSVGIYLTELLAETTHTVDGTHYDALKQNANAFGLFLQKLNIIRDVNEDTDDKARPFWPESYFQAGQSKLVILNKLCQETIQNDIQNAIQYAYEIPTGNLSYEQFIRFILSSGLEYLKLLINNDSIFSRLKVKLPRLFIKQLYQRVSALSKAEFHDYAIKLHKELRLQCEAALA